MFDWAWKPLEAVQTVNQEECFDFNDALSLDDAYVDMVLLVLLDRHANSYMVADHLVVVVDVVHRDDVYVVAVVSVDTYQVEGVLPTMVSAIKIKSKSISHWDIKRTKLLWILKTIDSCLQMVSDARRSVQEEDSMASPVEDSPQDSCCDSLAATALFCEDKENGI